MSIFLLRENKCPNNNKKFLFIKWNGEHDLFFWEDTDYEIHSYCKLCKQSKEELQKGIKELKERMDSLVDKQEKIDKVIKNPEFRHQCLEQNTDEWFRLSKEYFKMKEILRKI